MLASDAYVLLISSLPKLPQHFCDKYHPISELKLRRRLTILSLADASRLAKLETVFTSDSLTSQIDNEELSNFISQLIDSESSDEIRSLFWLLIDTRTVMVALAARAHSNVLIGNWTSSCLKRHIEKHWNSSTFLLKSRYPWIEKAHKLIEMEATLELEKLTFEILWQALRRKNTAHDYGFATVAKYVLQWQLLMRWQSYSSAGATERFENLLGDLTNSRLWSDNFVWVR